MEAVCGYYCLLFLLLGLADPMSSASLMDQKVQPENLAHHYFLGMNVTADLRDFDARKITWAHAVNSREFLEKELTGSVDFLEADVNLGHIVGNEFSPVIPVMAHPPNVTSDISLDTWLDTIIARKSSKGIKLDFKSLEVVAPSLIILERHANKLKSPIVLNADVLPGPINSSTVPVQMDSFLALCRRHFPKAVVSIGWTTYWFSTFPPETWHYEWHHVRKMVDSIRCSGYESIYPTFTFPVRGVFASRSIKELQWLLSVVPTSSLSVWSAKFDSLSLQDLRKIRTSFPKYRVYYDIPEPIGDLFRKEKGEDDPLVEHLIQDNAGWMTVTYGEGEPCTSYTYINDDVIVFGKSLKTAVLKKNLLHIDTKSNIKIRGRVQFFSDQNHVLNDPSKKQELVIVLADVKLFSKNISADSSDSIDFTQSDTSVIWSAINASHLHKFVHSPFDKAKACRMFSLDTTKDRSFEAWTVPCDVLREEDSFEEAIKSGTQEISFRQRLVLPEGPFMLGFISSGDEYVVLHDLEITGTVEGVSSGKRTHCGVSVGFLFATMLAVAVTLLF